MLEHLSHGLVEMAVHDRCRHDAAHFYSGVPRADARVSSMVDLQGEECGRSGGPEEGTYVDTTVKTHSALSKTIYGWWNKDSEWGRSKISLK